MIPRNNNSSIRCNYDEIVAALSDLNFTATGKLIKSKDFNDYYRLEVYEKGDWNMRLKIVDGVKNRITPTPSKNRNSKTETSVNYINICFLKYLNNCIGGDCFE